MHLPQSIAGVAPEQLTHLWINGAVEAGPLGEGAERRILEVILVRVDHPPVVVLVVLFVLFVLVRARALGRGLAAPIAIGCGGTTATVKLRRQRDLLTAGEELDLLVREARQGRELTVNVVGGLEVVGEGDRRREGRLATDGLAVGLVPLLGRLLLLGSHRLVEAAEVVLKLELAEVRGRDPGDAEPRGEDQEREPRDRTPPLRARRCVGERLGGLHGLGLGSGLDSGRDPPGAHPLHEDDQRGENDERPEQRHEHADPGDDPELREAAEVGDHQEEAGERGAQPAREGRDAGRRQGDGEGLVEAQPPPPLVAVAAEHVDPKVDPEADEDDEDERRDEVQLAEDEAGDPEGCRHREDERQEDQDHRPQPAKVDRQDQHQEADDDRRAADDVPLETAGAAALLGVGALDPDLHLRVEARWIELRREPLDLLEEAAGEGDVGVRLPRPGLDDEERPLVGLGLVVLGQAGVELVALAQLALAEGRVCGRDVARGLVVLGEERHLLAHLSADPFDHPAAQVEQILEVDVEERVALEEGAVEVKERVAQLGSRAQALGELLRVLEARLPRGRPDGHVELGLVAESIAERVDPRGREGVRREQHPQLLIDPKLEREPQPERADDQRREDDGPRTPRGETGELAGGSADGAAV